MTDPRGRLLRPGIEVFLLVSVRLYRDGIADALLRDPRFQIVGSAASLESARRDGLPATPDVVLVDLDLAEARGRRPHAALRVARGQHRRAHRSRSRRGHHLLGRGRRLRSCLPRRNAVGAARGGRRRGQRGGAVPAGRCGCASAPRRLTPTRRRAGRREDAHAARARDREPHRRRAREQGDRALAPDRGCDRQEPRAPHPREARRDAPDSTLKDLVATAQKTERDAAAERKQLAASLASKDVDAATRKDKTLAADVKAALDAVDFEEKQAKQRAAALDEARADWDKELKALKSLLP